MSTTQAPPRRFSPPWWVRDREDNLAVAQWPNPALAVWLVTVVVGWTHLLDHTRGTAVAGVGHGALVVWGLDEVVRGSSPVRRVIGAVVLVMQLVTILG